jgi:hypothetical protein
MLCDLSCGRVWLCQSIEHLAQMLIDAKLTLAVTQDEPCPWQVL